MTNPLIINVEPTAAWIAAHRECEHFDGMCRHADPNYIPTHAAGCTCNVCGHCNECQDGTTGPVGTYCLTCHRTQRPDRECSLPVHWSCSVERCRYAQFQYTTGLPDD